MRIWLIHLGELLPVDGQIRPSRYGILADELTARGHQVIRWAPTFAHATKKQRFEKDTVVDINNNYKIEFIFAKGYKKHLSIDRFRFHQEVASKFAKRIERSPVPDLILTGMPTPEMCSVAIHYAEQHHVPVLVDVRDLWPDIYLDVIPGFLRPLGRIALEPNFRLNQHIFSRATGIIAISPGFLDWGLRYARREKRDNDRVFFMGYRRPIISAQDRKAALERWIKRGLRPGSFICCFAGTIGRAFDFAPLIEAAKKISTSTDIDFQFIFCGDGDNLDKFKKMASGVSNIIFPGWVDEADIMILLENAQIGLLPYTDKFRTAIPNKLFDYLSAGLPVLSSGNGEIYQFIKDEAIGFNYVAGDPESAIDKISWILQNPAELIAIRNRCKKLFESKLSSDAVYPEFVNYLEEVIRVQSPT